jgi:sucrose phosphorylase
MTMNGAIIGAEARERLYDHVRFIYGDATAMTVMPELLALLERHLNGRAPAQVRPALAERLGPGDALLITYGDQISGPDATPLRTLGAVFDRHLGGLISGVHILPFYPYTSDDGFSVVDYTQIDPQLGSWEDVALLAQRFRLMFDAVVNHISASSEWFQRFLRDEAPYRDYFIVTDPTLDLSQVTRPRALPLLTPFETPSGVKHVWTTFSADQIDLNFANPAVMLEMIDILLKYAAQGAEFIRLDAIGYLWKEIGTRCIHLPQTHQMVQLWRSVFDIVAPQVTLITETNVPHADNISYFGDGQNEAQLVYQFPLAPLTLNAFASGDAGHLTRWAAGLEQRTPETSFFNFLASHDGIGVMPAVGILSQAEIGELVERTLRHGGHVSYKSNADGSQSAYELNITFFDALSDPNDQAEDEERKIDRFIAAQAIMLALAGMPGIYIHSLFGSPNDHNGVTQTGRYRSINRKKWQQDEIEAQLADPQSRPARVLARYASLLRARAGHKAFAPSASQEVLALNSACFTLLRGNAVLCVHNVSSVEQRVAVPENFAGLSTLHDLVSGHTVAIVDGAIELGPYEVCWGTGGLGDWVTG